MITIPVSFGELVDKLTILELKKVNIKNKDQRKNINYEYDLLDKYFREEALTHDMRTKREILAMKYNLSEINTALWSIEDYMRKKEKLQEFDAQFMKTARSVYLNNDVRAKLKRQLNNLVNSDVVEEKSYEKY